MTDLKEVLARSTQAIAAFTNAERVWFYLYDREHQPPGSGRCRPSTSRRSSLRRLKVSVDARSIAGMVFRTGEPYCTNDVDRDPYANRELQPLRRGRATASSRR